MLVNGSIVALVTPFNQDGTVNFDKLGELIEFHIANKTDAILVLGTTGETPTLTHEEDDSVVEYSIKKANKRIPIYVGAGSNSTQTQLTYCKKYEAMGAEGLLVITPYYNKGNAQGIYQHFKVVADAVNIPLILYNVPSRTGCAIPYEVVEQLSKHPNVAAIKEASGNISYFDKVAKLACDDFKIYSGNDDMVVPALSMGASGVISVAANIIPEQMHDMVYAFLDGDVKKSRDLQLHYLDFINALFVETNPIPIKEAMNLVGMNVGGYRLPLCEISAKGKDVLVASMKAIDLLK